MTTKISQLPNGQSIAPISGTINLDGAIIGASTPEPGTFTIVTVDNLIVNGNTISSSSGDINIVPIAGSKILLDGTVSIDAGIIAGASSITSSTFTGNLVGNVTGNVTGNTSGTAATVTVAAQTAITSLGTLTALQIDNLNIDGNSIVATSGALNITPASGSAIILDGTISVDAGVVAGATSISSTLFVGNLTGDVTGNVTGNCTGTAATVTNATQSAITAVGTLPNLIVTGGTLDNVTIGGATPGSSRQYRPCATTYTGTAHTLALADAEYFQVCSNAATQTITVPANATVAFPVGTEIDFWQEGAGQVVFAAAGGVTINSVSSALKLFARYTGATLKKTDTNTWALVGNLTL